MARDPNRLIPDELKGRNTVLSNIPIVGDFIGHASAVDAILAVVIPTFATMMILQQLPEAINRYSIFVMIIVAAIGFGFLAVIPSYTSLTGIIKQYIQFRRSASVSRLTPEGQEDTEVKNRIWEVQESTVEKHHVERIYVDQGVIERDDGTIVGAMKVSGTNLDQAPQEAINRATQQFSNFVNQNLDFKVQIYLTTRRFNPEKYLEKYMDRLEDTDVQNNEILNIYLNHYIERTPQFLSRFYYREYYVLVPVTAWDVKRSEQQGGILDLGVIPGVGDLLSELFGQSGVGELTETQLKQRQIDEARKRMQRFKQGGIAPLEGADADIITDANEYASIIKEFWLGRDFELKGEENFVRESPVVAGKTDFEFGTKPPQEEGDEQ